MTELIDVGPLTRGLALPVTNCRWSSGLPYQIGRQASVLVKMLQYQALPTARQLPHFAACCSIQLDCSISQTEGYLLRDCTGLNPTTQLKGLHTSRKTQQLTLFKGLKSCPLSNSCHYFNITKLFNDRFISTIQRKKHYELI